MVRFLCLSLSLLGLLLPSSAWAGPDIFRVAIMQSRSGSADHYRSLENYLKLKGIYIDFIPANDYPAAADMFAHGRVDGMFSGSALGGLLILKDLARPLVRPVDLQGRDTYHAVVVAPRGSPPFEGSLSYFADKRVSYCCLASAGEFFYRSLPGSGRSRVQEVEAGSHEQALHLLADGQADTAILKNMVWEDLAGEFPDLERVGQGQVSNPNQTLMVSNRIAPELALKVASSLLALGREITPQAAAAREDLGIRGFRPTTIEDFRQTLEQLRRSGVTEKFDLHRHRTEAGGNKGTCTPEF